MEADELLARLAATLRTDIAPAVGEEYPRTQAFMASVILERISRQLALGPDHAEAERRDVAELSQALAPLLVDATPRIRTALEIVVGEGSMAALGPLIDALYDWGSGEPAVIDALALIRPVLRRDIDRRMEIAG